MKLLSAIKPRAAAARPPDRARAFTLPELMVAVMVFTMMVLGIIGVWLFVMRWDELVQSKVGATELSRMSFDQLTTDIRAAKWWKVGSATNNGVTVNFTACTNQMDQFGNAIKVSSNSNTNSPAWAIYYFDTNACNLCYWSNGAANVTFIAQHLTNSGILGTDKTNTSMAFAAEQYNGNLAQDWQFKYMIVATLEYMQYQYPLTKVGSNYYYNYYRIQLKAASHCPN
jgi:prepilin-type N-terminal cleavage/methylation domain-containing protein